MTTLSKRAQQKIGSIFGSSKIVAEVMKDPEAFGHSRSLGEGVNLLLCWPYIGDATAFEITAFLLCNSLITADESKLFDKNRLVLGRRILANKYLREFGWLGPFLSEERYVVVPAVNATKIARQIANIDKALESLNLREAALHDRRAEAVSKLARLANHDRG